MKLTSLHIRDFLGVSNISVPLSASTLFAGDNGAGKSSVQNAVRLAICGEFSRIQKLTKKDYPQVIRLGAQRSAIAITTDDESRKFSAAVESDGTFTAYTDAPSIVGYLLDPARFALSDVDTRRNLLLSLSAAELTDVEFYRRVADMGGDTECAIGVLTLMRAGWDVAEADCLGHARDEKAQWKMHTGETWGIKKADDFVVTPQDVTDKLNTRLLTLNKLEKEMADISDQMDTLHSAIQDLRIRVAVGGHEATCPACQHQFTIGTTEQLNLDVTELAIAEQKLADLGNRSMEISPLCNEAAACRAEMAVAIERAEEATRQAALAHQRILKWSILADICSPSGIPRQLIDTTIKSINSHMSKMHDHWNFPPVQLRDDMTLMMGPHPYPLLSESERWVADASIAAALAIESGERIVMLDRLDVLSPGNRIGFLAWAKQLAVDYDVQTISFGTLKTKPEIPDFTTHWIAGGITV